MDFGDGLARHPTQLYESLFMLAMWGVLTRRKLKLPQPGGLFVLLMCAYFAFRFLVEFIRVEGPTHAGLTFYQWVSLPVLGWYVRDLMGILRSATPVRPVEPWSPATPRSL